MKYKIGNNEWLSRWLEGRVNRREEQLLDDAAGKDPFLSEALEGYRGFASEDHAARLKMLQKRIYRRSHRKSRFFLLRIAAALVFLLSATWVVWQLATPSGGNAGELAQQSPLPTQKESSISPETPRVVAGKKKPAPASSPVAPKKSVPISRNPVSSPSVEGPVKIMDMPTAYKEEAAEVAVVPQSLRQIAPENALTAHAQTETPLSGRVTNEQGTPLANVEVFWENRRVASRSNPDGSFSILPDSGTNRLLFSLNGRTREVNTAGSRTLEIVLSDAPTPQIESRALTMEKSRAVSAKNPEPEGGFRAYEAFIQRSVRYPALALQAGVEGKVTVAFTISANGTPGDFLILENPGYGLDFEAIRLLQSGPRWIAASPDQRFVYSVTFKLP